MNSVIGLLSLVLSTNINMSSISSTSVRFFDLKGCGLSFLKAVTHFLNLNYYFIHVTP